MISWTNVFSGKFLFTVVTALTFAWASFAHILNGEQVYGVIMLVVAFYFNKPDPQGGSNVSQTTNTISTTDSTVTK